MGEPGNQKNLPSGQWKAGENRNTPRGGYEMPASETVFWGAKSCEREENKK